MTLTQLIFLCWACISVESSRVLFLAPVAIRSHTQFFMGIAKALSDNGHEVTMLLPFSRGHPYVKEIVINVTDLETTIKNPFKNKISTTMNTLRNWSPLCLEALATQEAQDLKGEKFDLVLLSVVFSDCFLGIVHEMKVPYIWVTNTGFLGSFYTDLAGNPYFGSFVPGLFTRKENLAPDGLGFIDRFIGSVGTDTLGKFYANYYLDIVDKDCRKVGLCPADMPPLSELRMNASMVFLNSIKSLETVAHPYTQSVLHAGGAHLRPAQPLPQDLENWIQGSGEAGFVYFSLGSVIKPSEMPEECLYILLQVLGSLDQQVLWKWDQDTIENLPANIRIGKWIPQQDVLGHKKIRFFMTHGGLSSSQEAQYHGTPVISLPIFFDQYMNMAAAESQGWAQIVNWDNFTEENLRIAVNHVLINNSMQDAASYRSFLLHDQLVPNKDLITYWAEYVIRHNGAPHLKSPFANMMWYQTYNVDVWVTLVLSFIGMQYLLYKLIKSIYNCCRRHGKQKLEEKVK